MDEKYRKLLAACDFPDCFEFPPGFNYPQLEAKTLDVEADIQRLLGETTRFEGANHNQDASFSIAIMLENWKETREKYIYEPTIRFSNFGNLVTICWPTMIPAERLNRIVEILESHGFYFIPEDVLDCEYDGVMKGHETLPSWWVRYFDCL